MKPTIVSLEPNVDEANTISFETAFGEFSEARGRGRKRRQKRKLSRIEARAERKRAKQKMRAEQQEARQMRKDTRKKRGVERKAMGETEEEEELEETPTNTGGEGDAPPTDIPQGDAPESDAPPREIPQGDAPEGNAPPTDTPQGDAPQEESYGGGYDDEPESEGSAEGEYETTQDSDVSYAEDEVSEVDAQQGDSDDESGYTGEYGFDGAIMLSPEDAEWNEYFSSANGKDKINPKVKLLARQIEQNKQLIKELEKKVALLKNKSDGGIGRIVAQINKRKSHLSKLESKLAGYSKFEGDYSEAKGGKRGVAKRKAEVRKAKKDARDERKSVIRSKRKRRGGVTELENGLNADIRQNRIEVPAEELSGFGGETGLIGLDGQCDIDAPETRKFDLNFSNAEGDKEAKKKKRKKLLIGVGIGVVVGVLTIILIKKFSKK